MLIYLAIILYLEDGGFKINPQFKHGDFIDKFLIVDITEELLFRGWILNALLKKMSTWLAQIANNLLFYVFTFEFGFRLILYRKFHFRQFYYCFCFRNNFWLAIY